MTRRSRRRRAAARVELDDRRRDGAACREGATILDGLPRQRASTIPTLCYFETLTPVNVCRVCVVEVEGSRVLVPSCSRKVEPGMVVRTDSERVRHSRKMVLELLASSRRPVDHARRRAVVEPTTARGPSATGRRPRRRRPASATRQPATTTPPTARPPRPSRSR